MSIEIESRELPVAGGFMGDAGVPIEEQEGLKYSRAETAKDKLDAELHPVKKEKKPQLTQSQKEAQQKIAAYYEERGLDENTYRSFREKGERAAHENNGIEHPWEVVQENLRRLFPSALNGKEKKLDSNSKNGNNIKSPGGDVHAENKSRDDLDPQLQ